MSLTEDQKWQLRSLGLMSKFCTERDKLKDEGMSSNNAREQALATVLAEQGVEVKATQRPDPGILPSSETPAATARRLRVKRHRVTKATFADRTATIAEAIEWSAASVCLVDVVPKDAPSALAWSLLEFGRASPVGRIELMKSVARLVRPEAGEPEHKPFHHDPNAKLPDYLMTDEQLAEARS